MLLAASCQIFGSPPVFQEKREASKIAVGWGYAESSIGFVKVAGLINGSKKSVLLEIKGEYFNLSEGDLFGPYIVKNISRNGVVLWRR